MILPTNKANPTQTGAITRTVLGRLTEAAKNIRRDVLALLDSIPRQQVDADTGVVVNVASLFVHRETIYQYQIDGDVLAGISRAIQATLNENYLSLLPGFDVPPSDWFMYTGVTLAHEQGTVAAVENLASQTAEYLTTPQQAVMSSGFLNRVSLIRARVFENMQGLTDSSRSDLADTLARGMSAGKNPLTIATEIRERVGVSLSRAQRIARSEINNAHRAAGLAEDQLASERYELKTGLLHLSALSPTTRATHAQLHGAIRTQKEVREWYSVDGNSINCKCAETSVLLGEDGEPLDKKLIQRMKDQRERYFGF